MRLEEAIDLLYEESPNAFSMFFDTVRAAAETDKLREAVDVVEDFVVEVSNYG